VSVQSASTAECQLVEEVLAGSFLDKLPARLVGDKTYDSDPLDAKLAADYGIEMIAPNPRGRKRRTQDGRKLRRYRKRWKVERLFAWMHNFRRIVTRWEYHIENFLGFVHLAAFACCLDIYETSSRLSFQFSRPPRCSKRREGPCGTCTPSIRKRFSL
jgi:transposase